MTKWVVSLFCLMAFLSAGCAAQTRALIEPSSPRVFDIRKFGAIGDGKTVDTTFIAKAIDACKAAGGGVVHVPPGKYLTGPIDFVNNMTLQIDRSATLFFLNDADQYPLVETRWEGVMVQGRRPLIWAKGCHDIAITGEGTIDGQGVKWWEMTLKMKATRTAPGATTRPEIDPLFRRPPLVQIRDCTNVKIAGVTFQNSPFWTMHLLFTDHVEIQSAKFLNPDHSPNTDAVDVDSCRHVLIEDCHADVGDDAFCLKSGKDEDGRRVNRRDTEDVTVRHCSVAHAHGGVVIGSETAGGVRDIRFEDCLFDGTDNGLRIKSMRGRGGIVENVRCSGLKMVNVGKAIMLTMRYQKAPPEAVSARTPIFRDIQVKGVIARGIKTAGVIDGLEEMPITGITLSDLDIVAETGFECTDGKNIKFHNVKLTVETGPGLLKKRVADLDVSGWEEMVGK